MSSLAGAAVDVGELEIMCIKVVSKLVIQYVLLKAGENEAVFVGKCQQL